MERSLPKSPGNGQKRRLRSANDKLPRHLIGHWITLGMLMDGPHAQEWRVPYGQLEPSSFYVFVIASSF